MSRKHSSIEDFEDEDDMPCPCPVCGDWFDLMDGKTHPRKDSEVICADCADSIQEELDREEEIEDLKTQIENAQYEIKEATKRLEELGFNTKWAD